MHDACVDPWRPVDPPDKGQRCPAGYDAAAGDGGQQVVAQVQAGRPAPPALPQLVVRLQLACKGGNVLVEFFHHPALLGGMNQHVHQKKCV
eukprot:jgi/Botrbrau1/9599/Bobra.106_2s0021.1